MELAHNTYMEFNKMMNRLEKSILVEPKSAFSNVTILLTDYVNFVDHSSYILPSLRKQENIKPIRECISSIANLFASENITNGNLNKPEEIKNLYSQFLKEKSILNKKLQADLLGTTDSK